MIKRELYMQRIRPFIDTELIKVMTGIRRCGKSVMLELIQEELLDRGISKNQIISINFENLGYSYIHNVMDLHDEIINRTQNITGRYICFLMKFKR